MAKSSDSKDDKTSIEKASKSNASGEKSRSKLSKKSSGEKSSGIRAARDVARLAASGKKGKDDKGVSRGGGIRERRWLMSFNTLVIAIVILGVSLVAFAAVGRDVAARPRQNEDHWHSAYGVWDCAANDGEGAFERLFSSFNDPVGIHSHQDGVIHIHPWYDRASGNNANISHFLTSQGAEISEEAIILPDGRSLNAGVECDGEPSIITVRRWYDVNNLDRDPVIYTDDLGDVRFLNAGEAFVIARAPEGADVPRPPDEHVNATYDATPGLISRPPLDAGDESGG